MNELKLSTHATIQCLDGPGGEVIYLLVNHITNEITHLVMRDAGPPHTERLAPVDLVVESSEETIQINCQQKELGDLEPYNFVEFIDAQKTPSDENVLFWPYVIPETHRIAIDGKQIPPHELALRRGAKVEATDDEIGTVNEFLVDPKSGHITHIVIKEGHFWEAKEISIPTSAVQHISEKRIYLNINKGAVEQLPEIPIRRKYHGNQS